MKKALIIASCGLVMALIIGATTQNKPSTQKNGFEHLLEKKCTEPINQKAAGQSCAIRAYDGVYADMFLRELKRKIRRAFA